MAVKALPSQEVLRQLLDCSLETGLLTWRERTPDMFKPGRISPEHLCTIFNRNFAGCLAFTAKNAKGYLVGSLFRSNFLAHRVVWKWATGADPTQQIDHINGVTFDNRLENLREAHGWQNGGNRRKHKDAKHSQFRGVCRAMKTGHFTASISVEQKQVHLGSFRCEESAARAYDQMAVKKYGEFARLNFPEGHPEC